MLVNKGVSILKAKKKSNKQIGVRSGGTGNHTGHSNLRNSSVFSQVRSERKLTAKVRVARTRKLGPRRLDASLRFLISNFRRSPRACRRGVLIQTHQMNCPFAESLKIPPHPPLSKGGEGGDSNGNFISLMATPLLRSYESLHLEEFPNVLMDLLLVVLIGGRVGHDHVQLPGVDGEKPENPEAAFHELLVSVLDA